MKQSKSVAQKMGIKAGSRAFFVNVPKSVTETIRLPDLDVASKLEGKFDYMHLFTTSQDELDEVFPKLKSHLKPIGMLWVSWPKGRKLDTNLTLPEVIRIGYGYGLVESTTLSVDTLWSAIKLRTQRRGSPTTTVTANSLAVECVT